MLNRYLTQSEVLSTLHRGKAIEVFLGGCVFEGRPGVRWLQIRGCPSGCDLFLYEFADVGSENDVDLYAFGPLDPSLEQDQANEVHLFPTIEACMRTIENRWPGASARLVNEGMVQDEYADFQRGGSRP